MTDEAKIVIDALKRCSINDSDTVIDAIDLIERLSAENEALRNNLMQRKDCKNCAHSGCGKYRCKLDQTIYGTDYVCRMFVRGDSADLIERMDAELDQVKRERDAAVCDLNLLNDWLETSAEICAICKHNDKDPDEEPCHSCGSVSKWEWRGFCEDNSGGDEDAENRT